MPYSQIDSQAASHGLSIPGPATSLVCLPDDGDDSGYKLSGSGAQPAGSSKRGARRGRRVLLVRMPAQPDSVASERIMRTVRAVRQGAIERVVVDMTGTEALSDAGLALLLCLRAAQSQDVYLTNVGQKVREQLRTSGVTSLFQIERQPGRWWGVR